MSYAHQPGAGYRRYDGAFARAEAEAARFTGLVDVSHSRALAAFKRAAPLLGIGGRMIHLVDLLFAWTKPQDWQAGRRPIVWPKNETLAEALGIEIRQVQNLLRRAVSERLICHVDSPNGHRGGQRDAEGHIRWAYGIDLRPIGARFDEFMGLAEEAARDRRHRDTLRQRLTIARKAIAQLADTALDQGLAGCDWLSIVDEARQLAASARSSRSTGLLEAAVQELEQRQRAAHDVFVSQLEVHSDTVDITPKAAEECTPITSTSHLKTAKADIRKGSARKRSDIGQVAPGPEPVASVEDDLDIYGVDVRFIGNVCPWIGETLDRPPVDWEDLTVAAEQELVRCCVSQATWREACRILGRRGAAAAVIALGHKDAQGLIDNPGAYLRGMVQRATIGALHLGRTFHGFKESPAIKARDKRAFTDKSARSPIAGKPGSAGDGTRSGGGSETGTGDENRSGSAVYRGLRQMQFKIGDSTFNLR